MHTSPAYSSMKCIITRTSRNCATGSSADCCGDAPHLQDVVGHGEQFPFAVDGVEATPVEASRSSGFFDLSEDWLDGDRSLGVDGSTPFGVQFAFHSLQRRGR